ncbi:CMD domain protein [Microbacterium sp. A84]|uniref:CMD domain protein n=1 Tax=Microbacterium sp. A84 TaxID=3450715 RepID=UPI003F41DD2F
MTDVVNEMLGDRRATAVHRVRAARSESAEQMQKSFHVLVLADDNAAATRRERVCIATFTALLHGEDCAAFYTDLLRQHDDALPAIVTILAERSLTRGPYGQSEVNAAESVPGPTFTVDDIAALYALDDRLTAAIEFAHLLVFHPRDTRRAHLQQLIDVGWTNDGIVTLAQLIGFVTFQMRVIAGLSVLADRIIERSAA